jgi:hypothetical protein
MLIFYRDPSARLDRPENERFFSRHLGCGDALPEHGRARLPSELEISLGGIQLPHGKFLRLRNTLEKVGKFRSFFTFLIFFYSYRNILVQNKTLISAYLRI